MKTNQNKFQDEKFLVLDYNRSAYQVAKEFMSCCKENVLIIQSESGNGDGMTSLARHLASICAKSERDIGFFSAESLTLVAKRESFSKVNSLFLLSNVCTLFIDDVNFLYAESNQVALNEVRKLIQVRCTKNYKTVLISCLTGTDDNFNRLSGGVIRFAMIKKPSKLELLSLLDNRFGKNRGLSIELTEATKRHISDSASNVRHLQGKLNQLISLEAYRFKTKGDKMNLKIKEQEIFDEWAAGSESFVPDGVVSEQDFLSARRKICFVLKEVNDPDGGGWDLCEFISLGAQARTWNNIARWARGIEKLDDGLSYEEIEEVNEDNRKSWLKPICAMNLKKWPGGSSTIASELAHYTKRDAAFIKRQWELYEPDITICCGSGEYFAEAMGLPLEPWPKSHSGVEFYEISPKKFIFHYGHPQPRGVFHKDLYEWLMSAIKEVTQQTV